MKIVVKEYPLYTNIDTDDPTETLYDITCELTPEEKETPRTLNDGGNPGAPAECEIIEVKRFRDGKVFEAKEWASIGLDDSDIKNIEQTAFQQAADDEAVAKDAYEESLNDTRMMERIQDREDFGFHD